MPSLTLSDRVIWFAHCPKAGGTSVEQFMVAEWGSAVGHLHWGWDKWWRQGGWRVADPPNSPQHLIWSDALAKLPQRPDLVFAVVRDPVARMASEYRWQRHGRRGTWIGKLIARLPFTVWLRLMLAVARRNPHAFDNHLRPQTDFVPEGAQVFHLENGLQDVTNWLIRQTGVPDASSPVPHAIPSGRVIRLSARDRALIEEVFAVDFERFGYQRSHPAASGSAWADRVAAWLAPMVTAFDRRGQV